MLADPTFDQLSHIDMLIGAEYFYQILCSSQIKLNSDTITKNSVRLDCNWSYLFHGLKIDNLCHFFRSTLEKTVQRFWETEEVPKRKLLSVEEEEVCEEHYTQTVERTRIGHYTVGLPFNDQKDKLGESYNMALKKFQGLKRRIK